MSTNAIGTIAGLNQMSKLKILSVGRNAIKNLNGLEPVSDTCVSLPPCSLCGT